MARKSCAARIDEALARLRDRPREGEAGVASIPSDDWPAIAKTALTLTDDDEALQQLFAKADFDPNNPFHWAELARILAKIRFGSRKAGRPKRWGPEKLCQLLSDVDRVRDAHQQMSVDRICRKLVKENERYTNQKSQTLRRRYQDAINPLTNDLLQNILDNRDEADWLKRRRRRGRGLKARISVRQLMCDELIMTIMSGWRKIARK